MPNYKDDFQTRMSVNIAESKAEEFYKKKEIIIVRLGFNYQDEKQRIEDKDFFKIPLLMRSLPDYLIITDTAYLLEVKGCNDLLKVKIKDMKNYDVWNKITPLVFFVYSASLKTCYRIKYDILKEMLLSMGKKGIYKNDNKEYYGINPKELDLKGQKEII